MLPLISILNVCDSPVSLQDHRSYHMRFIIKSDGCCLNLSSRSMRPESFDRHQRHRTWRRKRPFCLTRESDACGGHHPADCRQDATQA
jgi:hypothetical protein